VIAAKIWILCVLASSAVHFGIDQRDARAADDWRGSARGVVTP